MIRLGALAQQDASSAQGINYTAHISRLMADIVWREPALSFIDVDRVLVFARPGRTGADGPNATCHSLNLPDTEPGYYFWRDRASGNLTRRTEWFVTRSPVVTIDGRQIDYLLSFSLPRFVDQTLEQDTRKRLRYPSGTPGWVAKLDTIVHELYHIDPGQSGLREVECETGSPSLLTHSSGFFDDVARMVRDYLARGPDARLTDFLRPDFAELALMHGGVNGATFRSYPSYPRRYREIVDPQPAPPAIGDVRIDAMIDRARTVFTEADLQLRRFDVPGPPVYMNEPAHSAAA